jgi:hypothetical protein
MANGGLEVVNRSEPEHNRLSDSENAAPVGAASSRVEVGVEPAVVHERARRLKRRAKLPPLAPIS